MKKLHDITIFKSSRSAIEQFEAWLFEAGATEVTVENYSRAVRAWLAVLAESDEHPGAAWTHWHVGKATKRMAGFACRRYINYLRETTGDMIDLGIPTRLPASSKPKPRPVSDAEFRALLLGAKRILPLETGYSIRVWLQFVAELGLRRSESEIEVSAINWREKSVFVDGKTGKRELPLSDKMLRRLAWLHQKNGDYLWRGARNQKLKGRVLYNIFKQVCAAAGAPNLHPHLLRHRRLTALCRSELASNQLLVLSFSGHASLSSLLPYYSVSMEEKRALMTGCRHKSS